MLQFQYYKIYFYINKKIKSQPDGTDFYFIYFFFNVIHPRWANYSPRAKSDLLRVT